MTGPDTVGGAFVQALAPDQYAAYADRVAERDAAQAATPPPAPDPAAAVHVILDRLERGKRATVAELTVLRDGITALQTAPRPALSDAERSFLTFALDTTADHMATFSDGFNADDIASLAALRKLAGGA